MSDSVFFTTVGLLLGTILLIFAMKYFAAIRQARARVLAEEAYRDVAQNAAAAQSQNTIALGAIQTDLSEIKTRLAAVETILKAVG